MRRIPNPIDVAINLAIPKLWLLLLVALAAGTGDLQGQPQLQKRDLSFSRDIRPILANHCYACHGPDEQARQADLRLDGVADVDLAELADRISSEDQDYLMPPPHHNKPLTEEKIKLLKRWLESGAKYERHWAFVAPVKTRIPDGAHPVDFFIDRRLKAIGRMRSREAEPAILIRRLYLDLIGIPPTIEQADAFISNPTLEHYSRIVDQLLESPRYGERWARRWLDLARYADTNGYEKDRDRSIWPYRDWVIRAINDGMPFDQFTIEQLAGDMLPEPTRDQLIATGFHRNTMLNEEGGIDPLEYRYYAMTDRVATTGTTWLGLTTGCAQCHTHKYDPITHEDYFGFMAYLNNADEPDLFFHTDETRQQWQRDQDRLASLTDELKSHWPDRNKNGEAVPGLEESFADWLGKESDRITGWTTIVPHTMSSNLPNLSLQQDGTILAAGDSSKLDTYTLAFPANADPVTALRLEVLPDPKLPGGGPGLTYYEGRKGDFFLAEIEFSSSPGKTIEWGESSETFAANQFGNHRVAAELATDRDIQTGWSIAGQNGFRHVAVFNLKTPFPPGQPFTISMTFGRHFASSLGKFRLSVTAADRVSFASLLTAQETEMLLADNAANNVQLQNIFLMQALPVQEYADEIRRLQHPQQGVATLVMRERPANMARQTWLHHRGEFTQPKHEVGPRLPDAISGDSPKPLPTNRLEFAKWIVSRDNPLTARVVVNRHWQAFFGTGIVSTLDDFGMQGTAPSHPLLLDWLAVDLMDNQWSTKMLHRLMVTSQTYRQASAMNPGHDAAEELLPRFPRRRLEAEVIRDTALAASGLLQLKMYGPPVRPPQPEGVAANYQESKWQASEGVDRFRRSIYTYQKRTAPFAMHTTFDASSGEVCIAQRDVSNTPLQALTLVNDPMFVEIAAAFGHRMADEPGDVDARIKTGFRRLLTRVPDHEELQMLAAFHQKHQDWTALARVLLCLDETITKN